MKTTGSNPPADFEPITSAAETEQVLRQGSKIRAPWTFWIKGEETRHEGRGYRYDDLRKYLIFENLDEAPYQEFHASDKLTSVVVCVQINLPQRLIFFATGLGFLDRASFALKLPEQVYKVQRRRDLRYVFPRAVIATVKVSGEERRIYDLSASGMSFLVPPKMETDFRAGRHLKEVEFTLEGKVVSVEAEVRHAETIAGKKAGEAVCKVGVAFRKMPAELDRKIANFVFEENRKAFSRFV
ncbi:MAG: PilZ domain-containing protein [Bdellovibrionota bacterium]